MSSGLYSITTRAAGTVLTAAIYNADHQNHVTNQNPSMTGAYSDNVAQMQTQTSPGGEGTESLAPSLAGELERLRYMMAQMRGKTYWYTAMQQFSVSGNFLTCTNLPTNAEVDISFMDIRSTTNGDILFIDLSQDNGSSWLAANYRWVDVRQNSAGTGPTIGASAGDSTARPLGNTAIIPSGAGNYFDMDIRVKNPNSGSRLKNWEYVIRGSGSDGNNWHAYGTFWYLGNQNAINAIRLRMNSATAVVGATAVVRPRGL